MYRLLLCHSSGPLQISVPYSQTVPESYRQGHPVVPAAGPRPDKPIESIEPSEIDSGSWEI